MKETLQQYAALKQQEREIQSKIAELAPTILSYIQEQGADKIQSTFGTFSLEKRKTWKFGEEILSAEEKLDSLKADAKATGKATFEEKVVLKYFEPK